MRIFLGASPRRLAITSLAALAATAAFGLWAFYAARTLYVHVSVRSPANATSQLYYDTGRGLNEKDSLRVPAFGSGGFHRQRFRLPRKPIHQLRLDPTNVQGPFSLRRLALRDGLGRRVRPIPVSDLHPLANVTDLRLDNDTLTADTAPGSDDPALTLSLNYPIPRRAGLGRGLAIAIGVTFAGILGLGLVLGPACAGWLWSTKDAATDIWSIGRRLGRRLSGKPTQLAATLAVIVGVHVGVHEWCASRTLYLSLAMASSTDAVVRVFFDTGDGVTQENEAEHAVLARAPTKVVRFPLSRHPLYDIRLDPLDAEGTLRVENVALTDRAGHRVRAIPFTQLRPLAGIREAAVQDGSLEITTEPGATSSMMAVDLAYPITETIPTHAGRLVLLVVAAMGAAFLAGRWALTQAARRLPTALAALTPRQRRLAALAALIAGPLLLSVIPIPVPAPTVPMPSRLLYLSPGLSALLRGLLFALYSLGLSAVAFVTAVGAGARPIRRIEAATGREAVIFWFLLPVALWTLVLFAFWPGVMTIDSVVQWGEAMTGRFSDWHPAFHTFTLWAITRVWASPAAVATVQILALAGTAAWSLTVLRKLGVGDACLLATAILFAVSLPNALLAVTLWKDVPYSLSVLALHVMVVQIVASEGAWLERRGRWIAMVAVAACAALFRHNGPAVAFGVPLALLPFYRRQWRPLLGVAILSMAVWAGVRGPVYRSLHVEPAPQTGNILMHPVAAHVVAGTPLIPEDAAILNAFHPLTEHWNYSPDTIVPLGEDAYDWDVIATHPGCLRGIFARATVEAPRVTLRHFLNVSGLVWRIRPVGSLFTVDLGTAANGWAYITPNSYVMPNSQWPGLRDGLASLFRWSTRAPWLPILWAPAFYLYAFLAAVAVAALRRRSWKVLLIALPVALHSGPLLLVNVAADFRYQYPVYLIALLFTLPLWFWESRANEAPAPAPRRPKKADRRRQAGR